MSLINDALLKARAQAALRADAEHQPDALVDHAAPFAPPPPRQTSPTLAVVLSVTLVLLAAILFLGAKAVFPPASARAAASLPPPVVTAAPQIVAAIREELAFTPEPDPEPVAETPAPEPLDPVVEAPLLEAPAAPEPAPPPDPLAKLRAMAGQTFIKTIDLPPSTGDGETLTIQLDGIVWSAETPVALLNGTLLRPGDELHHFRVTAIERKRVQLQINDVQLWLRLP